MSAYEKEMYDYFTREDNFEIAAEICATLPKVKTRLISEFWELVSQKLEEKVEGKEWNITREKLHQNDQVLGLQYHTVNNFYVLYGEFHGDVYWALKSELKGNNGHYSRLLSHLNSIDLLKGFKLTEHSEGVWLYHRVHDNFRDIEAVKNILPKNRSEMVNYYCDQLIEFAESLKGDILKMASF